MAEFEIRHFEFSDKTSNKFWRISLDGESFTVRFGKIGTEGQTQTKSFDTEDKAELEAQKLIKEKLKKGYIEKTEHAGDEDEEDELDEED